jgi:KUP system potassium uptake protein
MVIWFTMMAALGGMQIINHPDILGALNPVYAFRFLTAYKGSFILLGAVFLAITGAEAIYSDLGHCGRNNIRISWIFVKVALVLNYLGQGAWALHNYVPGSGAVPFFSLMPEWFLVPGLFITAAAAIIATQSLIRSSSTILTEAVSLNFWPKIKIVNPTLKRGQVYLPLVTGC